jgi:hypothetical protein
MESSIRIQNGTRNDRQSEQRMYAPDAESASRIQTGFLFKYGVLTENGIQRDA